MRDGVFKGIFCIVTLLVIIGVTLVSFFLSHSDPSSLNDQVQRIDNINVVKKYIKSYIGWNGQEGIWDSGTAHGQMYYDLKIFCDGVGEINTSLKKFKNALESEDALSRYGSHLHGDKIDALIRVKDEINLDIDLLQRYVLTWIVTIRSYQNGNDVPIKYLHTISGNIYIMPITDCLNAIRLMINDREFWVFDSEFKEQFRYLKKFEYNKMHIKDLFPTYEPQIRFSQIKIIVLSEIGSLSSTQFEVYYNKEIEAFRQSMLEITGEKSIKVLEWIPPIFSTMWWVQCSPWIIDLGIILCYILLLRLEEYNKKTTVVAPTKELDYPYCLAFPSDNSGLLGIGRILQALFFLLPILIFLFCIYEQTSISKKFHNLIGIHANSLSYAFYSQIPGHENDLFATGQTLNDVLNEISGDNQSLNEDALYFAISKKIYPTLSEFIGITTSFLLTLLVMRKVYAIR